MELSTRVPHSDLLVSWSLQHQPQDHFEEWLAVVCGRGPNPAWLPPDDSGSSSSRLPSPLWL